ncbi:MULTISPECIES: porin [unclassified Mesorhizobium]|uniref:porin n=1 Tax=unclassified Mesorhizobium TaxID=325217 RepID=UPI000FD3035A|nr:MULTISPECIES: porin [unclassified Mesorhizobium]RUX06531.1 porin [Mesorhizobium sp. M8A.F.Ca.ET.059.01.1.1]TGU88817.1 porin [Mesorhizobium sp. M00.F.Ca.ET.151.01.1.1]TGV12432.1 porin [Mesorhizobium sp. M8A.F.Ca.ET.173.01.1.1]TGV55763.1 porin [bacterium M00.F.Ca.ET.141.01.1.1]RWC68625.1 MAG: porin [Mesorhizobium sp.]
MNIKSLLLGSAAALIAVSGARAADAVVVAEPEPAEYVKICDVYGAGYFYIPGTETCLRIGGYVRYDIGVGDVGSFDGAKSNDHEDGEQQGTYYKHARFTLKTWTGQETELGTLKTYTETRFNFGNNNGYGRYGTDGTTLGNPAGNGSVSLNFAWIQLGGLRVGKDESAFNTFIGYAGSVINDTLVPYGDFDTNVVQYYFDAGNGFSAVVSLEEGSGVVGTIDSYVPHVVGGLKWTQGWGAISGVVAYDSNYEEVAGKVRLDVNVSDALSLFIMAGYGTDDNLSDPTWAIPAGGRGFYKQWGGNWAVWGGGTYKFNEKTSFNLQASGDDEKNYSVAANVAYDIVPGFTVTAEVDWSHWGEEGVNWTDRSVFAKKDAVGGMLRFQRSF